MQNIQIIGNLCKDPELNKGVAKFSVAVNESYNGEDKTEYFNCVAFKKTAENICKYLKKGSKVYVSGKQSTTKYEDKYYTSLLVFNVEFLSKSTSAQSAQVEPDISEDSKPF